MLWIAQSLVNDSSLIRDCQRIYKYNTKVIYIPLYYLVYDMSWGCFRTIEILYLASPMKDWKTNSQQPENSIRVSVSPPFA